MPKTPDRQALLPPYMQNEAWTELVEAVDSVLKTKVDDPTVWLSRQRDVWILKDQADAKIEAGQMLSDTDFELPEKEMLIRQANMLGFDFKEADLISAADYQRIVRNLSLYWYGKGKPNFIDFISYVLNSVITITNLWSTQGPTWDTYGEFLPEGDPGIGTPVWEGGEWFPTTHVRVQFDPFRFDYVSISKLIALFYSIANYNLVLDRVDLDGTAYIHSVGQETIAEIVCAYPMVSVEMTIETTDEIEELEYMYFGYVDPEGYVDPPPV